MSRKAKSEWERLAALRKGRGLTQEQMARIMGVSLITYKRWETNVFSPDYGTLGRMADYFGVSADYLLGRPTPNQLTPADRENLAAAAEAIADILTKTGVSQNENGNENKGKKNDGE